MHKNYVSCVKFIAEIFSQTLLASFQSLPRFCSSVCIQYNTWKQKSIRRSSASVYYTERKQKNKNGGGLGTKPQFSNLFYMAWLSWKQAWVGYKIDWGIGVGSCFPKIFRKHAAKLEGVHYPLQLGKMKLHCNDNG